MRGRPLRTGVAGWASRWPVGPLWRRAGGRLLRGGVWGLLVTATLVLLTAGAAAGPIFAEASANAALREAISSVPENANAADAPVARLSGGSASLAAEQGDLVDALRRVPGLSAPTLVGGSIGVELLPAFASFTPVAVSASTTLRARLFADADLRRSLVPAPGSPPVTAAGAGVWLPAPLAQELRVSPGDVMQVGVDEGKRHRRATTRVAGIYRVGADGRRPADAPGTRTWTLRRAALPADSQLRTLPAYLLVGEPSGVERLARAIGDQVLWSVEAALAPSQPTLEAVRRTSRAIAELRAQARSPAPGEPGVLRPALISGIPAVVTSAQEVASRTQDWTAPLTGAGIALGLAAVAGVSATGLSRRRTELRLLAGLGLRPAAVGALAALEMLAVVPLALLLGLAGAYGAVSAVGPPGPVTAASAGTGTGHALAAAAAGVALAGALAALATTAAARPATVRAPRRAVPWELIVIVAAVTAAASLWTRPQVAGPPGALDLLVPLLTVAAASAAGARLVTSLLTTYLRTPRLRRRQPSTPGPRWPAAWLAVRRLAGAGQERVLVMAVVGTGLGMFMYAVAASTSVATSVRDRVAVASGAPATAVIDGSWQIDPQVPSTPAGTDPPVRYPLPGVRVPPLPPGLTMVWRARISVPGEPTNVDILAVDPTTFQTIASWGRGPELAAARALLPELARRDRQDAAALRDGKGVGSVPALAIAAPGLRRGAGVPLDGGDWVLPATVLASLPAFPGHRSTLPLLVVPADSFLSRLEAADPRVRPPPGNLQPPPSLSAELWATRAGSIDAVLEPLGIDAPRRTTQKEAGTAPELVAADRSRGYQMAIGICLAAMAVLVLALYADRATARSRAADLMLARVGLGQRGPRRARALELLLMAAVAVVLAWVGVRLIAPLGARLLEPGGPAEPAFALRVGPATAMAGLAAALVALTVAVGAAALRSRTGTESAVLRDAD